MGYSLNKLKQELDSNKIADNGLVCCGQKGDSNVADFFLGGIGGGIYAALNMVVVCKRNDQLLVIPFTDKEIKYQNFISYKKDNIANISVKGLLTKVLTIKTKDGKKDKYTINQGVADLNQIVKQLGF